MTLACLLVLSVSGNCADLEFSPEVSEQEFARLGELANQGDRDAQCRLAEMYLWGWGTTADNTRAWQLFQQAAKSGSVRAMNRIGAMYEQGLFVDKDYSRALQWHIRSATLGSADAQSDAGRIYEDGLAGTTDIRKALYWYRQAADRGEPFAVEALQRLDRRTESDR